MNDEEGYTLCNCSRLAEFGLIMTFTARVAEIVHTREDFAVIILGIVIAIYTLSLALLLLARINNDHHFVLKNTLVSFLCLTASIFTAMKSKYDREGTVHCLLIAFCVNAFLLSACSCSLLAAVHLLLRIRIFIYRSSRARVSYLIIGWVSPVIYCLFSVAAIHTDYRDAKLCWFITGRVSLVIIIPAMVLYMSTLSVMLLTYRKTSLYRCRVKMEEFGLTLFDLRGLAFMFALFTLSWIAGMWAITAIALQPGPCLHCLFSSRHRSLFTTLCQERRLPIPCVSNSAVCTDATAPPRRRSWRKSTFAGKAS
ncbi:adhesion G-protein coupled receptor D1-like [Ptychodera flava]|uniref:adhesion G-protein coupled receptor D1-like n=1 Tax=Ptychodera flava TaxID=63121 RepID=UPI00396A21AC